MLYRASFQEFIGAAFYRVTPFIGINIIVYLIKDNIPILVWIVYTLTGLFCLHMVVETIFVYLQKIEVQPQGLRWFTAFGITTLLWDDIQYAVLRERRSSHARTMRLLLLKSGQYEISYVTSMLRKEDEEQFLDVVRNNVALVTQQDTPA